MRARKEQTKYEKPLQVKKKILSKKAALKTQPLHITFTLRPTVAASQDDSDNSKNRL
jgi:hypothetical protein